MIDELLDPIPNDSDDEIKEEETEEPVSKLRKGYGRLLVIDKYNMIVFKLDFVKSKTDIPKVKEYLAEKWVGCRIEEIN